MTKSEYIEGLYAVFNEKYQAEDNLYPILRIDHYHNLYLEIFKKTIHPRYSMPTYISIASIDIKYTVEGRSLFITRLGNISSEHFLIPIYLES